MKIILSVILSGLSLFVFAQHSGNITYNQTTPIATTLQATPANDEITLSVSGLLNAGADTFVAFFNITQVGDTAEKTDSLMYARITQFKDTLKKKTDSLVIVVDMISFVPKYESHIINKLFSKTYNEVPDGFELQKNISVSFHYPEDLDMIVSAAAKAEIYDLVKVDYFLNDMKSQYDKLRAQCMEVMKTKIKTLESLGIKTDARKTFSEDFNTVLPQSRYGSYTAVSRPSFQAVKKGSSSLGKISSADLSPTKYYDAVPYNTFDVVINPVINKPAVQLSYQVSLKILLSSEVTNKDLMLITPNGTLQKIEGFYK